MREMRMLTVFWIILGIIFILYGLLVLGTGSGTGFFAVWLIGGASMVTKLIKSGLMDK